MAGSNNDGGRAFSPVLTEPTQDDDATLGPMAGPGRPTQTPLEKVAQRVHNQASLLAPPTLDWVPGTTSAAPLMALAQEFHEALTQFRGKPTMAQGLQVNQAIFDLINAAIRLPPGERAQLDALTANLGALATARGFELAEPHPASKVIETSASPLAQVEATRAAVIDIVNTTTSKLAGLGDKVAKEHAVAAAAPRIVALLQTLTAPPPGATHVAKDVFWPMEKAIDDLTTVAKAEQLDMVGAGLDEVFEAEDAMLIRFRLKPAQQRKGYYADVNVSDLDADPYTRDESQPTGGQLVEEILTTYTIAPMRQTLALTTLGPVLQEPPPPRDVSLFERVLETIVKESLLVLGNTMVSGFTQAVKAIAANPGAVASAVGQGVADAAAGARDVLPARAQRGVDAAARAARRAGKAMAPAANAVRDVVALPPGALADLMHAGESVLKASGAPAAIAGSLKNTAKTIAGSVDDHPKPDAPSFSNVAQFLSMMGSQIDAYMTNIAARAPALRSFLERIPPDQLTRLRDGLQASVGDAYHVMRTTIAERWTLAIAAAGTGVDPDGTTAHAGTLKNSNSLPGVVRVRARIEGVAGPLGSTMPKITLLGPPKIDGVSNSMLAVFAERPTPLHQAHMQRTLTIEFPSPTAGAVLSMGTVDFGPDGQVDLSRADLYNLSSLALGEVPDRPYGQLEGAAVAATGRASPAHAERGARMVLEALRLSTADLR